MVCSLWALQLLSSVLALEGKTEARLERPRLLRETQPGVGRWERFKKRRTE